MTLTGGGNRRLEWPRRAGQCGRLKDMETGAIPRWPTRVWLPLVLLGVAAVAVVVVGVTTTLLRAALPHSDDPYSMIVWFNKGTSRHVVAQFQKKCGRAGGSGGVSSPVRSRTGRYQGLFVVHVVLPFGPDDTRSNPVLRCVNDARDVYDSVIPL